MAENMLLIYASGSFTFFCAKQGIFNILKRPTGKPQAPFDDDDDDDDTKVACLGSRKRFVNYRMLTILSKGMHKCI